MWRTTSYQLCRASLSASLWTETPICHTSSYTDEIRRSSTRHSPRLNMKWIPEKICEQMWLGGSVELIVWRYVLKIFTVPYQMKLDVYFTSLYSVFAKKNVCIKFGIVLKTTVFLYCHLLTFKNNFLSLAPISITFRYCEKNWQIGLCIVFITKSLFLSCSYFIS